MAKRQTGVIIVPPGVFIERHEKIAVDFIAVVLCYNVTFLVPDRREGVKTPDIEMNGQHWEIKSPRGRSSRTIDNNLRNAFRQSPYIILDLRRMDGRIPTAKLLREVEQRFTDAREIKHLIVITREENCIKPQTLRHATTTMPLGLLCLSILL